MNNFRFFLILASVLFLNMRSGDAQELLWMNNVDDNTDLHVGFRGEIDLNEKSSVRILISGASSYSLYVDGVFVTDGPDRFPSEYPVYQVREITLDAGEHLIAVHVHSEGVDTRILQDIDPFLYCRLFKENEEIQINWKCSELPGYLRKYKRVSPQFGWLEWNDTRENIRGWKSLSFNDTEWGEPVPVNRSLGEFRESLISPIKNEPIAFTELDRGDLANFYGYEKDDPSARIFLRDLECKNLPPQGIWKRYDLGRIRLVRPEFTMNLPEGATVEFVFSEYLRHGRVVPWINLSLDDSYNMVHFVARGGEQTFTPFTPRAGRFVEVHIIAPDEPVEIIKENFIERRYYNDPKGSFVSDNEMINRVWNLGLDTYRSCAEDALVDNPTRERGQWMGDAVVGMRIGAAGYSDLKIIKNALYHHAQCAREDGMVAGLSPGNIAYLSTFSALWASTCLDYYKISGEKSVLSDLYPYAEKNIAAFEGYKTSEGISDEAGWGFIDWGYVRNEGPSDMGVNLMYYGALQDMIKWTEILNYSEKKTYYQDLKEKMENIINNWYKPFLTQDKVDWKAIGYHRTVLGMKYGFIADNYYKNAVKYLKEHILSCFPNNPDAPRLSDPGANNPQLITPYFSNYAFPLLIENGESEFVLDQYKSCWGWMLEQGATTCLEVFDTRWSHCHGWSGSPSWQLSRYFLGLHHDYTESKKEYTLKLYTGNLENVSGTVPMSNGENISIQWEKDGDFIVYSIHSPVKITLNVPDAKKYGVKSKYNVKGDLTIKLKQVN